MRDIFRNFSAALLIALAQPCAAQATDEQYIKFLHTIHFLENYKQLAEVSAGVFAGRGQGTDIHAAREYGRIAKADLTPAEPCLVKVYKAQPLTSRDLDELTAFYSTPAGAKLLAASQQRLLESIRQGAPQPMRIDVFSPEEKQQIERMYEKPSFRKYGALTAARPFAAAELGCIAAAAGLPLTTP